MTTGQDEVVRMGPIAFAVSAVSAPAAGKDHDAHLVRPDIAVVADGATPLPDADNDEIRRFAQHACAALAAHAGRPVREMLEAVIRGTRSDAARLLQPSCAVAAARRWGRELELVSLGDCLAVALLDGGGDVVALDDRVAEFERPLDEALGRLLRDGRGEGDALAEAHRRIPDIRRRMNRPGGYWVLADDVAAAAHAVSVTAPLAATRSVLLASDGFARLWDLFGVVASPAALAEMADTEGLTAMVAELRRRESYPSSLRDHPRLSPEDDVTAVLLTRLG